MQPFKDDIEKELDLEIGRYIMLEDDLTKLKHSYETFKDVSKDKIISMMKTLDLNSFGKVKRVLKRVYPPTTVEELKNLFNDNSLADLIVVSVDVDKTFDNLMIKGGFSEQLAKKYISMFTELNQLQYEELEIKK